MAATRSVAPDATSPPKSPGCSESVVTTSSPGPIPSPRRTMLQPSVVEPVSATCSGGAPIRPARAARSEALGHDALEARAARPTLLQLLALEHLHGLDRRARERTERARVQVGVAVEDRETAADGYEVDAITTSIGAWSESTVPSNRRRSSGHGSGPRSSSRPRTRIWSIPPNGGENPATACPGRLKSPESTHHSAREERRSPLNLGGGNARVGVVGGVQVAEDEPLAPGLHLGRWQTRR